MYCAKCGAPVQDTDPFCRSCGARQRTLQPPVPRSSEPSTHTKPVSTGSIFLVIALLAGAGWAGFLLLRNNLTPPVPATTGEDRLNLFDKNMRPDPEAMRKIAGQYEALLDATEAASEDPCSEASRSTYQRLLDTEPQFQAAWDKETAWFSTQAAGPESGRARRADSRLGADLRKNSARWTAISNQAASIKARFQARASRCHGTQESGTP